MRCFLLGCQPTLLCQGDSSFHLIRLQQFFTVIHSTVLDVFGPGGGQYSQEVLAFSPHLRGGFSRYSVLAYQKRGTNSPPDEASHQDQKPWFQATISSALSLQPDREKLI